jgi:hypothetical protein
MKTRLFLYALAPLALCEVALAAASGDALDVRRAMQDGINPATMAIWDIGNNAMGDDGGIDPAQMTPEKWAQLEISARDLRNVALTIHEAGAFISASPDNLPEAEEGAVSMEDVQKYLDANPEGVRAAAQALADHAGLIANAAKARDAAAAGDLIGQMDQVCEACHATYWYPDQQ